MPRELEASSYEGIFCVPQVNKANGHIRPKNFRYLKVVDVWSLSMKTIVWTTLQVQSQKLNITPPPPVNAYCWYLYKLFGISFFIKQLLLLKSFINTTTLFGDATCLVHEYDA